MSRTWLRRAIVIVAASVVLPVTLPFAAAAAVSASAARAADPGASQLAAAMVQTGDLPAGFQPYAPLTGPLNAQRAQVLAIDLSQLGSEAKWVRTWVSPAPHDEVIELAFDAGTHDNAQAAVTSVASGLAKQGAVRQTVAGPARFDAYSEPVQVNGAPYVALVLPLARGPYFFLLRVYVPAASAASASSLMSMVATAQWRKVPADTPDTAPSGSDLAEGAAGTSVGALVGYLAIVDGIAYLRNPLRRRRRRRSSRATPGRPAGPDITDVSGGATRSRRLAVGRLAVQLTGLSIAVYGVDTHMVGSGPWYAFVVLGLAVVWAGGRFIHPAGVHRDKNRAPLAGSHRIFVTGLLAVAATLILLGLVCLVFLGFYQMQPSGTTVPSLTGQGTTDAQSVASDLELAGLVLVVLGAIIFRTSRRLGSIQARRLMLRDPRPPVLYLRAFGDDRLRLWTATFGRPSLIERFTLRRFDTFEEVLVRHLSRYGPVIAVNPPRTRLAPLGAARETIDSPDWQSVVADLMARSSLIVLVTPPREVTGGLRWELESVTAGGYWDKALIVVPPVRAEDLQHRWEEFQEEGARLWPFTVPGPVADPHALVLAFRHPRWTVIGADRRTEWSYGAALRQAVADLRERAPAPPQAPRPPGPPAPGRRTVRGGPLTLPVVALIVVLAAAVTGVGSWYAVRSAPAAHLAAVATPTSSPDPSSPDPSSPSGPATVAGSSSASASPSPASPVSLAPAAALYPEADQIESVISTYFQAINGRDYTAYLTTQSPGQALTAGQFQTGFRSTQDSNMVITSIGQGPDGRPAADVTFTSRQQPQDGPEGESCTDWQVTMFFDGQAGTYTIGAPAGGYHASYQACA